jgi:hypothetical protein
MSLFLKIKYQGATITNVNNVCDEVRGRIHFVNPC